MYENKISDFNIFYRFSSFGPQQITTQIFFFPLKNKSKAKRLLTLWINPGINKPPVLVESSQVVWVVVFQET